MQIWMWELNSLAIALLCPCIKSGCILYHAMLKKFCGDLRCCDWAPAHCFTHCLSASWFLSRWAGISLGGRDLIWSIPLVSICSDEVLFGFERSCRTSLKVGRRAFFATRYGIIIVKVSDVGLTIDAASVAVSIWVSRDVLRIPGDMKMNHVNTLRTVT